MQNVKRLLQQWKHERANADGLLGTDCETMNVQEFNILGEQIQELEDAIKNDETQSKRWAEEESEFNNSLNVQRFTL
ncbi:hypothetical protein OAE73_00270 [bacterium]|nr:hypothetical protein [bacterium]